MTTIDPALQFTTTASWGRTDVRTGRGDIEGLVWQALGGTSAVLDEHMHISGPETLLPSIFDVTGLATATVAAATLAAAELLAVRTGSPMRSAAVERRPACAGFVSEALFSGIGWERPAAWDPIAGDYEADDGWIRLHTNYRSHREAVERVVGTSADKAQIARIVRTWSAAELEAAVVEGGGCAATMHDRATWNATPAGAATASEPLVRVETFAAASSTGAGACAPVERPFSGLRVLDLTRVIAGPVCTRFLAAYGADVLRIDPRGFEEVGALVPETSAGKHCAMLDLTDRVDRERFDGLLRGADVIVIGMRSDALGKLGLDTASIRSVNPSIVTASLDAYGWDGPWQCRRGFDSLVQMSCGIAAAGAAAAGRSSPTPLPAQALDHGTGYLLAAAVGRAITERYAEGVASDVRCSLIGTANTLMAHPNPEGLGAEMPRFSDDDTVLTTTAWGPARRVPVPGSIDGVAKDWKIEAGPLGRHRAAWRTNA